MKKQKVFFETTVQRNHCSIIDLSALGCDEVDPVCVFSNDLTGVPLFLTHDQGCQKMSMEHTHAPAETLVFGDKGIFQKRMKDWWLSKVK